MGFKAYDLRKSFCGILNRIKGDKEGNGQGNGEG